MTIGIIIQFGILWFLITFYTRQTNNHVSSQEAKIVLIGLLFVTLLNRFLLVDYLGLLVLPIEILALYMLVDKVCGTSRRVTIRICIWYLVAMFIVNGMFYALETLVTQ